MKHMKFLLAAAVIVGDAYFGSALSQVVKNLRRQPPHQYTYLYGALATYAVLLLLTLLVIVLTVRGISARRAPKPAPQQRTLGYPYTRTGGPR